ncbi:MAG: hypothetical protein QME58_09730 [Bacteroidota bacterium]|nr:hypothetical protein [Bacteroidota bacterium]
MNKFTKHIIIFIVLFFYTLEGAAYGNYSLNLIFATFLDSKDSPEVNNCSQDIRPIWTQKKHTQENNQPAPLQIYSSTLLSYKNILNHTPLWICEFGLISSEYFFENKDRSPPLS